MSSPGASAPATPPTPSRPTPLSSTYRWQAARLALGTASALGLARFAYGLLVPAMRSELGWSLAQAGAMTTANALGYLAGAIAAAAVIRRLTTTATFRLGMVISAFALAATAAGSAAPVLLAARAAAGFAGALVFITGGVLTARIATSAGSATPIAIYFGGAGLGIVLAGATLPPLLDRHPGRWPLAWLGLALAAGLATAGSWTAARADGDPATTGAGRRRLRPLWRLAVAYVLFGAGYIAYITFLSAYLTDHGATAGRIAVTWTLLGLGVVVAPGLWNRPITTWPGGRALGALLVALAGAATLPLLRPTPPVILASAIAYGATFMGVPAAVTARIRATTSSADWPPTLAVFTVLFAAGQTVGPWVAGALADHAASGATLAWTATLCAAAAALAAGDR